MFSIWIWPYQNINRSYFYILHAVWSSIRVIRFFSSTGFKGGFYQYSVLGALRPPLRPDYSDTHYSYMYQYIIYKTVKNAQNGAAGDPSGASECAGFHVNGMQKMVGNWRKMQIMDFVHHFWGPIWPSSVLPF